MMDLSTTHTNGFGGARAHRHVPGAVLDGGGRPATMAAMALGIAVGLKNGWKQGIGSAIGGVVGGIVLSLVIANAAGFQESGNQELQQRGIVPNSSVYGR